MTCGDGGFHFVDLLGLHLHTRLPIPESDRLLELLHTLTDVHLPMLVLFPHPIVEAAREELHRQYPWLTSIGTPTFIRKGDWGRVWAWIDTLQHKHGSEQDGFGTSYRVTPIPPERMPEMPQIVIMRFDPEDEG
jgi:hypothetical protein